MRGRTGGKTGPTRKLWGGSLSKRQKKWIEEIRGKQLKGESGKY